MDVLPAALLVAGGWTAEAVLLGLVVGRAIRIADRKETPAPGLAERASHRTDCEGVDHL